MTDEQLTELDTDFLQANPLQPRGIITPESLSELVESVREKGILEPIVVAKTPAGYQIIAGERRWRAAKVLGLPKVPVVIKETTPQNMLEMSIVENVQREDLNPIERAQAYRRLVDEFGLTVGEIATKIGKSVPYVSNTLRLLALPDAIKDALASGVVDEGHVRPLLALPNQQLMLDAFRTILKRGGTARMAEDLTRRMKGEILKKKPMLIPSQLLGQELEVIEKELKEKFGANDVIVSQSNFSARISFIFRGKTEQTAQKIKNVVKILQS